jgi:hypothetical protein
LPAASLCHGFQRSQSLIHLIDARPGRALLLVQEPALNNPAAPLIRVFNNPAAPLIRVLYQRFLQLTGLCLQCVAQLLRTLDQCLSLQVLIFAAPALFRQ